MALIDGVNAASGPTHHRRHEYEIVGAKGVALLTREQEVALAARIQAGLADGADAATVADGRAAESEMVRANLRLASNLTVLLTRKRPWTFSDGIGAANEALLIAARKFDPAFGTRYSTYACRWIRQCVDRELTDHGRSIRIPAHHIRAIQTEAEQPAVPTRDNRVVEAQKVYVVDRLIFSDQAISPQNVVEDVIREESTRKDKQVVTELLDALPERYRDVVKAITGIDRAEPMPFNDVAAEMGVTYQAVRTMYRRAIRMMQHVAGVA